MFKKKNEPAPQEDLQESDDEEASTSSEDEPEWTQEHESAFLKTLGALKSNKDDIYKDNVKFWDNSTLDVSVSKNNQKESKAKPMFLKDYERKVILEKEGKYEDSGSDNEDDPKEEPGYYEQQEQIRKQIQATIAEVSDDDDDLLFKRTKTTKEEANEEKDYYEWLKTQNVDSFSDSTELNTLKKAWNDPSLNGEEKFLRDYLLNKEYETDDIKESIPTYDEIVDIEKDEDELNQQEDYETKYNFRFENPDQDFIKHYPRTVAESLRGANSKRKEKRKDYKTRKAEEKEARKKEIAQKKMSTKKHIEAKLAALRKVTGDDIPLNIEDLEGDFDPKKFDERMKELFDNKYYADGQDYPEDEEMEKPIFSDMEEEEDGETEIEPYNEEEDLEEETFADLRDEPQSKEAEENLGANEGPRRKESRRKTKRAAAAKSKSTKPVFVPNEKTFEEYLDEYYSLNYDDIIGDQVTKFKYRQVVPNNYGLNVKEILDADDQQLNSWVSLKRVTAYKPESDEKAELRDFQIKAVNTKKKDMIFNKKNLGNLDEMTASEEATSNVKENESKKKKKNKRKAVEIETTARQEPIADEEPPAQKKARRRKKKPTNSDVAATKHVLPADPQNPILNGDIEKNASVKETPKQTSKEKRKFTKHKNNVVLPVDTQRLMAFGINPKKFANKLKYAKQN